MLKHLFFYLRDLRNKQLFRKLSQRPLGKVLDVGGGEFYQRLNIAKINYVHWTCLEIDPQVPKTNQNDSRFTFVAADGGAMPFPEDTFDSVLNIQVLEHVFDPLKMLQEMHRVLKPSGVGIFLIPQTANLHGIPNHFYNFTRYWIYEAMQKTNFKIVSLEPIGGFWSTMASRLFYFFPQALGHRKMTLPDRKQNLWFYILSPIMFLVALLGIPLFLLLSLGDLAEEANNHLVVVQKK